MFVCLRRHLFLSPPVFGLPVLEQKQVPLFAISQLADPVQGQSFCLGLLSVHRRARGIGEKQRVLLYFYLGAMFAPKSVSD